MFYQQERKRILEEKGHVPNNDVNQDSKVESHPVKGLNDQTKTVKKKRGRPRDKNYKKKCPHRKIGFEELTKCISKRWKSKKEEYTKLYQSVVEADKKRYEEDMIEYRRKKKSIEGHRHDVPIRRGEVSYSQEIPQKRGNADAENLLEIEPLSVCNSTELFDAENYSQMHLEQFFLSLRSGSNQQSITESIAFCNHGERLMDGNPIHLR